MTRLTLGVVGHRFLTQEDSLRSGVDRALSHILKAFPHGSLRLLCSLAEGPDRLVSRIILEREHTSLWVPLPIPQEEYVRDFASMRSKEEFLELLGRASRVVNVRMSGGRDQAYLDAGRYILDHSDVLLAIWDGGPSEHPGDTAEIVLEARRRELPIAWVHTGSEVTQLDAGEVSFENFPSEG
jgi:hypothetical protein